MVIGIKGFWLEQRGRIKKAAILIATSSLLSLNACSIAGPAADEANPFAAGGTTLGARNNNAIAGASGGGEAVDARKALEAMSTYRRARAPQPVYPTINPAEVRLMWIPDHLTYDGNLIPAHYYYLKVLHDEWAIQDAFEIEGQLNNSGSGGGDYGASGGAYGGSTPWVYKEGK